jgi:hypothetical protein
MKYHVQYALGNGWVQEQIEADEVIIDPRRDGLFDSFAARMVVFKLYGQIIAAFGADKVAMVRLLQPEVPAAPLAEEVQRS